MAILFTTVFAAAPANADPSCQSICVDAPSTINAVVGQPVVWDATVTAAQNNGQIYIQVTDQDDTGSLDWLVQGGSATVPGVATLSGTPTAQSVGTHVLAVSVGESRGFTTTVVSVTLVVVAADSAKCRDSGGSPVACTDPSCDAQQTQVNDASTGGNSTCGTGGTDPTQYYNPGLNLPCFNSAGSITNCSNTSCDPVQTQLMELKYGDLYPDTGACTGTGTGGSASGGGTGGGSGGGIGGGLGGTGGSPSSGLGSYSGGHVDDVGTCIDINPLSFKLDIPCLWAWLVVPSAVNSETVALEWNELTNHRQPFAFLGATIQEGTKILSTPGKCTALTVPFDVSAFNIHAELPILPCNAGFHDFLRPVSTFLGWAFIAVAFAMWFFNLSDFSFNTDGGE